MKAPAPTRFIAVDGEGVDVWVEQEMYDEEADDFVSELVKEHRYVLLSIGDESLHHNGIPLTWRDIFPFLWRKFEENPDAAFVGFFLGYDFTMWLKGLTEKDARKLLTKDGIESRQRLGGSPLPFPVIVENRWEIDILGAKRFKLRPYVRDPERVVVNHRDGTSSTKAVSRPWVYVCDAGSFYQTSLLKAIDPSAWSKGSEIIRESEYDILVEGKRNRASARFSTAADRDTMIQYNVLENEVLVRLMERLDEGLLSDNISLNRQQWMGPGQAAQAWMRKIGLPKTDDLNELVPPWAAEACRKTYFGGWFEIFVHGHIPGDSWAYDINSAYPAIIATLPCLRHGHWTRGRGVPLARRPGNYRAVHATVAGADLVVGAMLHRNHNGSILRPNYTEGWFWEDELDAATRAGIVSEVTVSEWVEYRPCKCPPPIAEIRDLYLGRLSVGKNTPEGKSKKVVYNSAYGKFAQSIGTPTFGNAFYASRITSGCRSMILDAIATHPGGTEDVLMVATDSVTFATRHPTIDIDETRLGAWDETKHRNLTLLMPGMYWDDKTRQAIADMKPCLICQRGEACRDHPRPKLKSRGVPSTDLAKFVEEFDEQFSNGVVTPTVDVPIAFAIQSAKMAAHQNNWESCGRVTHDGARRITADPIAKRVPFDRLEEFGISPADFTGHVGLVSLPDGRMVTRSLPHYDGHDGPESLPYDRMFGREEDEPDDFLDVLTPDGPLGMLFTSDLGI